MTVVRKIGLIGCGRWGKNILRDLLDLNCEVHVVTKPRPGGDENPAGAASCRSEITDELAGMDAFVVATPIATHSSVLRQLAPLGKPVYCEKALTTSLAEARELRGLFGDQLFVMHKWRYHPGIIRISQMIRSGELGDLLSIRIIRNGWGNTQSDVNAPLVFLPHDLSVLLSFMGEIPPVTCVTKTANQPEDGGLVVVMQAEETPTVCLEYSILSPETKKSFTVVGERATIQLSNSFDDELLVRRGRPGDWTAEVEYLEASGPMPLLRQLKAFLAYLAGGEPPMSLLTEALSVMQRIEEISKSAGLPLENHERPV